MRAGRLMLEEISARVRRGESFAFETALAGLAYARAIPRWRAAGYHVKLIFLALPSVAVATMRVATRVAQGGHDVPPEVIRRRFESGLRNFHERYRRLADVWNLYDNGGVRPVLLEFGENP